jgi:chromosome segregation ATPase
VWVAVVLALVTLGYVLYQIRGYRLLCQQHRHLRDVKAGQRQVYRGLEVCQSCYDALLTRVPYAVRPAPYAADDERAIALWADLSERMALLCQRLRPLELSARPRLALLSLLGNRYHRQLAAVRRDLAFAHSLRGDLADLERLMDELQALLARLADKPEEVRRAFADLQGMAEALGEEIELEQRAGMESLVPLAFEVQAVRARAMEWVERLRCAGPAQAPQMAIDAEALRPQLLARLTELYGQAGGIAGVHDQVLRALERLDAALQAIDARLAALRPALAEALRPPVAALHQSRAALKARYKERDLRTYEEISQQAWSLVAKARSLDRQDSRLAEADERAIGALEGCTRALAELQQELAAEREASQVQLDLSEAALGRAASHTARMSRLLACKQGIRLVSDPAAIAAVHGEVERLAAVCQHELGLARDSLEAWQSQRRGMQELIARLDSSAADHERITRAWQELQTYNPANWPQLEADWYESYCREREAILAGGSEMRARLGRGRVLQSAGAGLQARCEQLAEQWQRLLLEGQRVTVALARVQALERQLREGLAALRPEVEAVAAVEQKLPSTLEAARELRELCRDLLTGYRRVEEEARWLARSDMQRLRDEGIAHLHEQLAMYRLSYAQLVEGERVALKRQLALLWEQWEPLEQRMAKASPATEIARRELARRWEALVQASRSLPSDLGQVLELSGQADVLAQNVGRAREEFQAERESVRRAEVDLAHERWAAAQVRESVPKLLRHPHPQVVDEEWARSTHAWRKAEDLLRRLEARHGVGPYLARLDEVVTQYREARARGHSALVRLLRYALLEDPDGMHEACLPLGRRWGRLGVTAREAHIRDLLSELEEAGQLRRLVDRVGSYLAGRAGEAG